VSERRADGWHLTASGHQHLVEITGSLTRTITWSIDGRTVATKRSSEDTVRLRPDDADGGRPDTGDDPAGPGTVRVAFTALGRPRRVTWYPPEEGAAARVGTLLGTGGIDLDPAPGSPAALREARIRRHPRRYAALAVAGGVGKVVLPLLLGLLVVRLVVSIPWPDWDLPSIPWPDVDLPSVPWPDVELPDWQAPGWVAWLADKAVYVWPVVLAAVLARAEIRRRRQQDALKARLAAERDGRDGDGTGEVEDRPGS
jgi:hypothetical protein